MLGSSHSFILLLLTIRLWGAPLTLLDFTGPEAQNCRAILAMTARAALTGENIEPPKPSSLSDLQVSLWKAGIPPSVSHYIGIATNDLLNHPKGSVLKKLSIEIKALEKKKEILVCIAGQSCTVKGGDAVQVTVIDGIKIVDFDTPSEKPLEKPSSPSIVIRAIFLPEAKNPAYLEPSEMIPVVIHELMHVADSEAFVHWIKRNETFKKRGVETDPFYSKVVRYGAKGIEVERAFYVAYMEGRARLAEREARRALEASGIRFLQSERELAEAGYNQIMAEGGAKYLEHWNVTPEHFFDKFETLDLEQLP